MKLIGVRLGEYEGNKYARLITTEPMKIESGSRGDNAVVSKIEYALALDIVQDWELYRDQSVTLLYDRYGRVTSVNLAG